MGGSSANVITNAQADLMGGKEGAETHTLVTTEIPAHTHTYSKDNNSSSLSASGASFAEADNTINTGSTGGDGAHENMSPYLILNWFIFAGT